MKHIYSLSQVDRDDTDIIGMLAARYSEVERSGTTLLPGFIIPIPTFLYFLRENNLHVKIKHLLSTINRTSPESFLQTSTHIKKIVTDAPMPQDILDEIFTAYQSLSGALKHSPVVIRESTHHDAATSFDKTKVVEGDTNLVIAIKKHWSEFFNPEALQLHMQHGLDQAFTGAALLIQKDIHPDISGVLLTSDPVTGSKSTMVIEALRGESGHRLGKASTHLVPDHFEIDKSTLHIKESTRHPQTVSYSYGNGKLKEEVLPAKVGNLAKMGHEEAQQLCVIGKKLEGLYLSPLSITWIVSKNNLYIRDISPLHIASYDTKKDSDHTSDNSLLLAHGVPASPGITTGPVRVLRTASDVSKILPGEILVMKLSDIPQNRKVQTVSGMITEQAGRMSKSATFSRELGIPSVVGVVNATGVLKTGMVITLNGLTGKIYKSTSAKRTTSSKKTEHIQTATKVYVSMQNGDLHDSVLPPSADGIGLLASDMYFKEINIHPKKAIDNGKRDEFIRDLAKRLMKTCETSSPLPVMYRAFDMTTQELSMLSSGKEFEPVETNPALGYRGAYRYVTDPSIFQIELEAIKAMKKNLTLDFTLIIPFVRTVDEMIKVKKLITDAGLYRSASFKILMMVDIPANLLSLEKFVHVGIDGFMVDITRLGSMLHGADKRSSDLIHYSYELDEALFWAIEHVIKTSHKHSLLSYIHSTPSPHPELLEKFIHWGVSGIVLSHSQADGIKHSIAEFEKKRIR